MKEKFLGLETRKWSGDRMSPCFVQQTYEIISKQEVVIEYLLRPCQVKAKCRQQSF